MKKTIFAAFMAVCLMAGSSVFAQDAKKAPMEKMTVEQMAQKRTEKMTKALQLNEKQAKQVYDYNLEKVKAMKAKHDQVKSNDKASNEKMKAILTPEQYTKWEQMSASCAQGKHGKSACCKEGKAGADGACCKDKAKDGKQCKGGCHKDKK